VKAIVLAGAGKSFSGGADIASSARRRCWPSPRCALSSPAFEASPKPVIAALNGVAMGGGLELPLGCHFRVAAVGTQVALPK